MKYFAQKLLIGCFMFAFIHLIAQEKVSKIALSGQVSSWVTAQFEDPLVSQIGGRFVPTMLGKFPVSENYNVDFEASLNINGSANFSDFNYNNGLAQLKPYRIWARYSTDNWELRAG